MCRAEGAVLEFDVVREKLRFNHSIHDWAAALAFQNSRPKVDSRIGQISSLSAKKAVVAKQQKLLALAAQPSWSLWSWTSTHQRASNW